MGRLWSHNGILAYIPIISFSHHFSHCLILLYKQLVEDDDTLMDQSGQQAERRGSRGSTFLGQLFRVYFSLNIFYLSHFPGFNFLFASQRVFSMFSLWWYVQTRVTNAHFMTPCNIKRMIRSSRITSIRPGEMGYNNPTRIATG